MDKTQPTKNMQHTKKSRRLKKPLIKILAHLFAIDLRAFVAFRIALAILFLADIINRFPYIWYHYTDLGLLPRRELKGVLFEYSFSFFYGLNQVWMIQAVFIIFAVFALMLLVGYRTKLMLFLIWVFLVSIHNRNGMVLQAGDNLLRVIYFWAMFLPLGANYSVDAALSQFKVRKKSYLSISTAALLLQGSLIYFATFFFKTGPAWHPNYDASWFAMNLDQFNTELAYFFRDFPEILKVATKGVFWLEGLALPLLFFPFFTASIRFMTSLALISMHLGFFFFMELGLFPMIDIACLMLFFPKFVWDKWSNVVHNSRRKRSSDKLTIFYDSECGFCRKGSAIIGHLFGYKHWQVKPAPKKTEIYRVMSESYSWVVQSPSGVAIRFEAFCNILKHSPYYFWMIPIVKPRFVRNLGLKVYNFVAYRRGMLSRYSKVLLPEKNLNIRINKLSEVICLGLFILVVMWNGMVSKQLKYNLIHEIKQVVWFLRLDQKWNMFSPNPPKYSSFIVFQGKTKKGDDVDPFNQTYGKQSFARPEVPSETFVSQRWRKYMLNISKKKHKSHRLHFGRAICRKWNMRSGIEDQDKLNTFSIYLIESKLEPYDVVSTKNINLWNHNCFKKSS